MFKISELYGVCRFDSLNKSAYNEKMLEPGKN